MLIVSVRMFTFDVSERKTTSTGEDKKNGDAKENVVWDMQ